MLHRRLCDSDHPKIKQLVFNGINIHRSLLNIITSAVFLYQSYEKAQQVEITSVIPVLEHSKTSTTNTHLKQFPKK